jgi:hypothetical protein
VVSGASVGVPIVVDGVQVHGGSGMLFFRDIILFKSVPTPICSMSSLEADLACRSSIARVTRVATTLVTATSTPPLLFWRWLLLEP